MKKEIWKKVKGYSSYEVSNFGKVRSYKFRNAILLEPRLKKIEIDVWGYSRVNLCKKSICKHFKVHRLVSIAFLPNNDNLPEVNHKDGNKNNNFLENLEWTTRSDNIKHSFNECNRIRMRGELNGHAVLNKEDVFDIKKKWETKKYKQREIAELFGVARTTINAIVNNYNWKHLTT